MKYKFITQAKMSGHCRHVMWASAYAYSPIALQNSSYDLWT